MAGETNPNLNKVNNRPAVGSYLLFFLSIAALGVGFWQIKTAINLPFHIDEGVLPTGALSTDFSTRDMASLARDTDGDGLLDYDETNIYNTSPYLADSDSDGFSDGEEIKSGNNPNCPAKQTCLVAPTLSAGEVAPQNVEELRKLLKDSGISQEDLDKIDDTTLLSLYQDINLKQPASTDATINTPTDVSTNLPLTAEQKAVIKNMTPAELRQFLKEGGAPAETIDSLDDASITTLVNQVLGI